MSIDCSDVPYNQRQRSVLPCAVQRIVVAGLGDFVKQQQYIQSLPHLTALDVRGCWNPFVGLVPVCSRCCTPLAPTLVRVASEHNYLSSVLQFFCAATLRVLYANRCQNATKLEVLHVASCRAVTSVSPFVHSLLELVAASCGICSAALSKAYQLQDARDNDRIHTQHPVAGRLRELHIAKGSSAPIQQKFFFTYVPGRRLAPLPKSRTHSTKANMSICRTAERTFTKLFPSLSGKGPCRRNGGANVAWGGWWKGWISSWRWWAPVEVIKGS